MTGENSDESLDPVRMAATYVSKGNGYMQAGKFKNAMRCYSRAIDLNATAEGYTFRGWAVAMMGDLEQAIEDCRRAIKTDPAFGNPYNDIGAYLLQLGRPDEAIPWLKKAMRAEQYEARHYPHFNLGQIYESQGKIEEAVREYEHALKLFPGYSAAQAALARLKS